MAVFDKDYEVHGYRDFKSVCSELSSSDLKWEREVRLIVTITMLNEYHFCTMSVKELNAKKMQV